MHYLGVTPGAVSAFSILNDKTNQIGLYIDAALMTAPELHIHPLVNTQTTTINRQALLEFLAIQGHPHQALTFAETL